MTESDSENFRPGLWREWNRTGIPFEILGQQPVDSEGSAILRALAGNESYFTS
jgi:hypothetical protein